MKILIVIFIFLIFSCKEKTTPNYQAEIDQNSAINDVIKDTAIQNAQVIAIGEASHGISEFQTLRRDLFWELQRKLGFNAIFLEAGYAECFRIDQYIKNNTKTSLKVLLDSLDYYPWRSQEMINFVEELRVHNISHGNELSFYGVDMQFVGQAIFLLKQVVDIRKDLFSNEQIRLVNSLSEESIFNEDIQSELSLLVTHILKIIDSDSLDAYDKMLLYNFQIIEQYISLEQKDDENIRDQSMAQNLLFVLKIHPESKAILIAHNGHIAKSIQDDDYKPIGYHLKNELLHKYFALGTECGIGSFIAANPKLFKKDTINYFQIFSFSKLDKGSFPYLLSKVTKDKPEYYLNSKQINSFSALLRATDLLGVHETNQRNYWKIIPKDYYDGVYYFSSVSPLNLYFVKLKY
jgi:erythromycin esterase